MEWPSFCGAPENNDSATFSFDPLLGDDFSPCLQLLLQGTFSVLLFFASISYFFNFYGYRRDRPTITSPINTLTNIRCAILFILACATVADGILYGQTIEGENQLGSGLYYLTNVVLCGCGYIALAMLAYTVRYRYPTYLRGPAIAHFLYFINVALFIISFRSLVMNKSDRLYYNIALTLKCICGSLHMLYCASLIPPQNPGLSYPTHASIQDDEQDPLLSDNGVSYRTFSNRNEHLVGETGNIFSWLFFWWVNPLMKKGKQKHIHQANDVFKLPKRLNSEKLAARYYANLVKADEERRTKGKPKYTIMSALYRTFGIEYFALGIMKLSADGLGFAGPLLLNALISYMENAEEVKWHGYLYAGLLFTSTLCASLLTTQFDYAVNMVGIKIRTSMVSSVYKKMLSVNTVELSRFTSGETVNFMSTDVDRVVNFCPSFHQFWSLPFQIAVSLYLLYLQVGWAFLAGLAFAVVLIPVNRQIAVKIGQLSTKMMSQKDLRVKTMNELVYGIRVVKLFNWESFFKTRVTTQRDAELSSLKGRKYLDALCVFFWACTPVIISILTFSTYSLMGNSLTAPKVFTSLALFNMLIGPLNAFPWVVNGLVEAWVSVKRAQQFMNLTTHQQMELWSGTDRSIRVNDGQFTWQPQSDGSVDGEQTTPSNTLRLSDINLSIDEGLLVGVIGRVGSGKSSLFYSMLNEMTCESPRGRSQAVRLGTDTGIGLVTQQAWIQQGTLKDNILMGEPMAALKYSNTISACALTDDFKVLPDGDMTQVGENGVTLSGGQRTRLTLARALYQDFDIYLLDDPLAAVDANVARHLFDHCIKGSMAGKTRILCTHHVDFLHEADLVLVMENGLITASGKPEDILPEHTDQVNKEDSQNEKDGAALTDVKDLDNEEGAGAVVEEDKDSGTVKLHVYKLYANAIGPLLSVMILLSMLLMQSSRNINDWWLSYWVSHSPNESTINSGTTNDNSTFYLEIYGGLAGANTMFTLMRAFLFAYGGVCAAANVHDHLLNAVIKAPMSFFDTTATGRIINRFSSDVYTVDDSLPFIANILLSQIFSILGTLVITIYGLPWFALVLLPLCIIYYYIQSYYRHTSRELKRIASVTLSEVYSHLNESVEGRPVIRAFNYNKRYEHQNIMKLDRNQCAQFSSYAAAQWLNVRLQALGVTMVTAIAFIAVLEHNYRTVDPGLVGLAISYALSINNLLSGVVSTFTETEKQMVSVERADQYIEGIMPEHTADVRQSLTGTIDGDENIERGNWSRQLDFLLSCLGYAVGLGNVWRFPYLSYQNGGGAFFIPYFIMLIFVGMPVFFLELSLGQFTSQGAIGAFKFCPILQGAAVGMVLVSATVCLYYGVIIAWAFRYLVSCFTKTLPWENCYNSWNTEYCADLTPDISKGECPGTVDDLGFCYEANSTRLAGIWNSTAAKISGFARQSAASEYYRNAILKRSSGIHELGFLSWELSICLIVTWIVVFLSLYKGVKSSGKVVYFTALFPYAVLIILFFRGITLPGAGKGISYYVTPEWHRLKEPKVWKDAAGQIFFSLSMCWGGLMALSSYNRFRNNVLKDTIIVSVGNCSTSIFAGFVIYSYIGNLSHELKADIKEVSQDGAGLAFVIYPMAVLNMPGSQFWAVLFFIMIITLGLDTQFTLVETVTTTALDMFPNLIPKKHIFILGTCICAFVPGLLFCTQAGSYLLKLVDSFASGWNVIIICILETTAIAYIYGYDRFAKDVKVMIGRNPPIFWKYCIMGISQVILLFVMVFDWALYKGVTDGNYKFPPWANGIGWCISVYVILPIPILGFYNVMKARGSTIREKIINASKATYDFGPALPKHRMFVDYVPGWQVHPLRDRASVNSEVAAAWPDKGEIKFQDVKLRYQPHLPYVLCGLNIMIQSGEKIGIVGRTGSGKSSLFNVLFRTVDAYEGSLYIDGVDIATMDLPRLRTGIAIIPQSPFLFSGTIRENLDPHKLYDDNILWEVLTKCHLKPTVNKLGGLNTELAERGRLFSIGQSQLLCLARAMLLRCRILCIDEATANVDMETDDLIQETIRQEFTHCTVLTIAHRVSTVLQCDKILVMRRGSVAEFNSPDVLLDDPDSLFSNIVQDQTR